MPPRRVRPGQQPLPRDLLDAFKRERTAQAVAELSAKLGPGNLTVALITKRAKMARNTFYEVFGSRNEALRFTVDLGNRRLKEVIEGALARGATWEERVRAAVGALIEAAEANPALIELALVHGYSIQRPPGGPFDVALLESLAGMLRAGRQETPPPGPGPRTEELLAHGILSVLASRLQGGGHGSLGELGFELVEFAVRPFLGRNAPPRRPADFSTPESPA